VKFEWIPTKCSFCGMFHHLKEVCRKKVAPIKEWRRVEPGQSEGTIKPPRAPPQPQEADGFTLVTNKTATRTMQ